MSQSIARLKELLFDAEAQNLANLAIRIEDIAALDAQSRDEIKHRIEELFARVGDHERLTASVAEILAEALRKAEVADHTELSHSIAPLVVSTIKAELKNSQDEMVEALYPITGRLVKSYVASAMKDLADQINRRLEQNPIMLRIQSALTGRSVGELALAGTQEFEVRELYLIRRGTGALLARWPEAHGETAERDHAMSGILAAINEFATDAFDAEQSSLRQIDFGDEDVYLRASPLYLLAARCSGRAPRHIESLLDEAFLTAVSRQNEFAGDCEVSAAAHAAATLPRLGHDLKARIADAKAFTRRPAGRGLLKALATIVLLPIAAWFAYSWYGEWSVSRVRLIARDAIAAVGAMQGYPTDISVALRGRQLVITGLAPSDETKSALLAKLESSLPRTTIKDHISVVAQVPPLPPDLSPELAKVQDHVARLEGDLETAATHQAIEQTLIRLEKTAEDLNRAALLAPADGAAALAQSVKNTEALIAEIRPIRASLQTPVDTDSIDQVTSQLSSLAHRIAAVGEATLTIEGHGASTATADSAAPNPESESTSSAAEAMAAEAQRLQSIAGAILVAATRKPAPPQVISIQTPTEPDPRQRLTDWTKANAVFFANATEYRNPDKVAKTLSDLSGLLKQSRLLLRIVGYTDEAGGAVRNVPLAQQRAERVLQDLVALGVDSGRLVAVGRADTIDISPAKGAESSNRRVEFEVGFEDEIAP